MEDVMNSSIRFVDKFRIVLLIVTIAPLWLMLPAISTCADAQATSSPGDWTQFHRDNMQRWNPYETVLGVGNVGGLQVKWKYQNSFTQSSPAVANGVVYLGSSGGGTSRVFALNATTGTVLWSYYIGDDVVSSPAVANGVVYFTSQDKNVYALNASTGALLWLFRTQGALYSSPAVVNGVVYIGSTDTNVYALKASTGETLWSSSVGNEVQSSPAVVNGTVYVGARDGYLYALNASTGVKLWSYPLQGEVYSSPAVSNGVVYVGSQYGDVYALNATTGVLVWHYSTTNYVWCSPAVANGKVYVGFGDGNVDAFNAGTGALVWSYATGAAVVYSSPAVANGVVYVGSRSLVNSRGTLYALDADTGAKLWSYTTAGYIDVSPAVANGVVYIGSNDGNIYAFGLGEANTADLFLRIIPSTTTVHQGDLLTFAFPVWNLGPAVAEGEVLSNLQVPAGTTFDYIRISGTPGLGTCTHPPYGGTGQIVCHEGDGMAPNTTWTVRLTVKVTAPAGTVITANAATMADTPDPNMANNTATVSLTVQ